MIRLCDSGEIGAHKIPGSKFRRRPRRALIRYIRKEGVYIGEAYAAPAIATVFSPDDTLAQSIRNVLYEQEHPQLKTTVDTGSEAISPLGLNPDLLIVDFRQNYDRRVRDSGFLRSRPDFECVPIFGVFDTESPELPVDAVTRRFVLPRDADALTKAVAEFLRNTHRLA